MLRHYSYIYIYIYNFNTSKDIDNKKNTHHHNNNITRNGKSSFYKDPQGLSIHGALDGVRWSRH